MDRPAQHQDKQPGIESEMIPQPVSIRPNYKGSEKLKGRVALVSGGDSGIGRSIVKHYAREGADIAIVYLNEKIDAEKTRNMVEDEGQACLLIEGDCRSSKFCRHAIEKTIEKFHHIDILVNCIAEQHPQDSIENISEDQLFNTFSTNVFSSFYLIQSALQHMKSGSTIINTGSVTSFRGSGHLIDYAATKGAIQALTFSLARELASRGIRVNGVAPGPIWTPLIPASFSAEETRKFGSNTLMKRAGEPAEVAPAFVFLASEDASFITGQFIHINGGGYISA